MSFPPEDTLHLFNLMCSLPCRPVNEESEPSEVDAAGRWRGVYVNRTSPAPSDSATTVKSLIKSFDVGHTGILQNSTFKPKPTYQTCLCYTGHKLVEPRVHTSSCHSAGSLAEAVRLPHPYFHFLSYPFIPFLPYGVIAFLATFLCSKNRQGWPTALSPRKWTSPVCIWTRCWESQLSSLAICC